MALSDYTSAVDVIKKDGSLQTVGTPSVTVLDVDSANNVLLAKGATIPTDGDAGYAVGSLFIDTDQGSQTTLYVNEGSTTSADFNAIAVATDAVKFSAVATTAFVVTPGGLTSFIDFTTQTGCVSAATGSAVAARIAKVACKIGNGAATAYIYLFGS